MCECKGLQMHMNTAFRDLGHCPLLAHLPGEQPGMGLSVQGWPCGGAPCSERALAREDGGTRLRRGWRTLFLDQAVQVHPHFVPVTPAVSMVSGCVENFF